MMEASIYIKGNNNEDNNYKINDFQNCILALKYYRPPPLDKISYVFMLENRKSVFYSQGRRSPKHGLSSLTSVHENSSPIDDTYVQGGFEEDDTVSIKSLTLLDVLTINS